MSDWQTQVDKLPEDYEGITRERYAAGLAAFRAWYVPSYSDEPDVTLLTDDEVRDYRFYLTCVKGYKAATVNAYLAPIRAIVRAQGRTLTVKGVTPQVSPTPIGVSYRIADFVSENREIYRALRISRALFPGIPLRFVGDSGLDDQKNLRPSGTRRWPVHLQSQA
jgi:hypothetical protein